MKLTAILKKCGWYRGFYFEVMPPDGLLPWRAYVYINLEQLPEEIAKQLWLGLEHVGSDGFPVWLSCSSYEKRLFSYSRSSQEHRGIKVGCDYGHLHDGGETEEQVVDDTMHVINWVHDNWSPMLMCCRNGALYQESEGQYKDGLFYSTEHSDKEVAE